MSSVIVIEAPEPFVSLQEAKDHLVVQHDRDDALIETYIAAAIGHIDGPAGWLRRCLGEQVLEVRRWEFGCGPIPLLFPPVITIEGIDYTDDDGAEQVVSEDDYALVGSGGYSPWVRLKTGKSWPDLTAAPEAVRIQYRCGYEEVPAPIRAAVLLMVGDLYAFRETGVVGTVSADVKMSTTVSDLLSPFQVF